MLKEFIAYHKDNPNHYWFRAKLFGWGWVPVRWQGWLVTLLGVGVLLLSGYVAEVDDAPGALIIGIVLMLLILIPFCYWKGEKPRWQWGVPNKYRDR